MSDKPPKDRFGIAMLYPTLSGGREWFSSWDNGIPRAFMSICNDPCDSEFSLRGNKGEIEIDGQGIANLCGNSPRMYIYDINKPKWQNVEITFYGMRVTEKIEKSPQGFVAGARSEHQDYHVDPCLARTYYGRLLYNGRVNFQKELYHTSTGNESIYASNKPSGASKVDWGDSDQGGAKMPSCTWIGYKFIVQNIQNNTKVKLSLLLDRTEGKEGGKWESLIEYIDDGNWQKTNNQCTHPNSQILLDPGTSIFVRNDGILSAKYMRFSIREIVSDK